MGPRTRLCIAVIIVCLGCAACDGMAEGFAQAVADAAARSGRSVSVVHVVGGGAQNALLCQALADRSGRRVVADTHALVTYTPRRAA